MENLELRQNIEKEVTEILFVLEPLNHGFILDFIYNEEVVLQLVHQSFIDQFGKESLKFGFGLNLTFDPDFPGDNELHEKFKQTTMCQKFVAYIWERIPCYAIDLGKSVKYIVNTCVEVLEFLNYTENIKFELVDEGEL